MENIENIVKIDAQVTKVINYALQQNGLPVIQSIKIQNGMSSALESAVLKIWTEPEISLPTQKNIEYVSPESSLIVKDTAIVLKPDSLYAITERESVILHVALLSGDETIAMQSLEITLLAFDEWHGTGFFPELVTAFVTPNHTEVTKIIVRAAQLLEKWTSDPSFDAYQRHNPNRVLQQAAAIYGAIQEQNIVYSVHPASFEAMGQRVRLCHAVIEQHMGNCLDLTLLYASCLEAIGLNPLLIIRKEHIFAGLWLEELSFSETVQDDPALITKRLSDGINEMEIVECTAMVSGRNMSFDDASRAARQQLNGSEPLDYIIDVHRARMSGIRPLPLRVREADGWKIIREKLDESALTTAPTEVGEAVPVMESQAEKTGKIAQWERKLLDLGLRNSLINMRLSKTMIPVLASSLGELEDALSDGSEFGILPKPLEWRVDESNENNFEMFHNLGEFGNLIKSEFNSKRLRTSLSDSELNNSIVNLYRASKVSLEENGANTLYIAMGLLRWYETKTSQKPRYAPVVLLPIEIVRKSANKGYVIRLRDEDPQMNITLLEMLKQDFGITISGLDPLPSDEHGIDLRSVFAILRKAVMGEQRWDVLESAYLGVFSFSQFVMWNDMRNRIDDLEKNKIVRSLIDGKLSWQAEGMLIGDHVSETEALLPIPTDASQLYAIIAASKGQSFVLHGPPGTGKSQTITALISNVLAQGKTVLFVAEKMAALSVVQKRLENLGIGSFCLELHSNKSKKKDVLEQLRIATEVTRYQAAEALERKAAQAEAMRHELDTYAKQLHSKRHSGISLYEMINVYEANREASDTIAFSRIFADELTAEQTESNQVLIERLIASAKAVGHPSGHPLERVNRSQYAQTLRADLPQSVSEYQAALTEADSAAYEISLFLNRPEPGSFSEWDRLATVVTELKLWQAIPRAWANIKQLSIYLTNVQQMAQHFQNANYLRDAMMQIWTPEFLYQNGVELKNVWESISVKWFLPKLIGQNKIVKSLQQYSKKPIAKDTLISDLTALANYQYELQEASRLFGMYGQELGFLYNGEQTDWQNITGLAQSAIESSMHLDDLTGSNELRIKYSSVKDGFALIDRMLSAWNDLCHAKECFEKLLSVQKTLTDASGWLKAQQSLCQNVSAHSDDLKEWMIWQSVCREAESAGLGSVVEAYTAGLRHDEVLSSYQKGLHKALIESAVDSDENLSGFSGAVFSEKIEQFRRIDHELTELSKQEIYCRLAARVPDFTKEAAQNSELGILQRAIRSGGRGVSIRRLFEQIPNLLPRLCPCMLMSPISAAQYLDPKRTPFDIVVFDEASQLPTCKAVGALARGMNAVIVGDPKQMPPTSFFTGNIVDEDNLETEDLESILDDCLALNMPQTHLRWHYRSRHESLIAFSNNQFYENKLFTFPSVNDRESKVSLVHVDGFFDRGKTRQNRAEAEAVVGEIIRRCHDEKRKNQSVGIVTFNISQQNLIDDLFVEACKTDAELESWASTTEEQIFIKNLENVQGDERDVILFSVGYGPDNSGKVYMNFGPLNRDGGWRRLNVAVSRARCEMVVFSALNPDQIDLSRTSAEGVKALKAFLEYAENGKLSADESTKINRTDRRGVAESICGALDAKGYKTNYMVGHSEYRIDIGIVDPSKPNSYLLGILLDGPSYGSAKTTRDREIAQTAVLNGLGWKIHRIWTMDWWDNSRKEMERLLACIDSAKDSPNPLDKKQLHDSESSKDEVVKENTTKLEMLYTVQTVSAPTIETYFATELSLRYISPDDYLLPQSTTTITERINEIMRLEAPITEGLLTRRILQSLGITRAGSRVQARTNALLTVLNVKFTVQDGEKVYWRNDQEPSEYRGFRAAGEGNNKREARDLPIQEIVNAVCQVLKEQIGLPFEDLIHETAKLLGYSRLGPVVVATMSAGIEQAKADGRVIADEIGNITLLS